MRESKPHRLRGTDIRSRLFWRILFFIIPVIILANYRSVTNIERWLTEITGYEQQYSANLHAKSIESWFRSLDGVLEFIKSAPMDHTDSPKRKQALYNRLKSIQAPEIQCTHLTDIEKQEIVASSCPSRIGMNPFKENLPWAVAGSKGKKFISQPFLGKLNGQPIFAYTSPVFHHKKQTHILSVHVNLYKKAETLAESNSRGYIVIFDKNGTILTHTNQDFIFKGNIYEEGNGVLNEIAEKIKTSKLGFTTVKEDDHYLSVSYHALLLPNAEKWGIFVVAKDTESILIMKTVKRNLILSLIAIILFDIIFTYYISAKISRPIEELANIATTMVINDKIEPVFNEQSESQEMNIIATLNNQIIRSLKHKCEIEKDKENAKDESKS